ncbi:hypothetical protein Leryth_005812 [Lithospermum erythrorhizon]|nr:hypothetical protein Leryth_005812 [Lithospermum erythrorhizon]
MRRLMKNSKLTLLCLLLTIVVLRGTLGAGKFGTPEQDLIEIRETFSYIRKRADPRRFLEKRKQTNNVGSSNSNNYATFDIRKFLADEEDNEEVFERASNEAYRLGAKILDWDEQRAQWLKKHPGLLNFLAPNKPRVLLVTGSSPKPCENAIGDHYLLKSIKNKIDYCRLHGVDIFYNMALLDAEMAVGERYKDSNMVMHGWNEMVFEQKNWIGLNTGSFLMRNCQWSLDILDAWAPMGPKGKVRNDAGKILTRELKDRPVLLDDHRNGRQEREQWGDKVYLESSYYLHGYWGILVDRYEEMIENYKPGLGDHRWPLVTHFVGCKPCAKSGDFSVEKCLKQMNRAFNFGDNQILQIYGFTHDSLGSRKVKRIRNETSNPLAMQDAIRLLQQDSKAV